MAFPARSGYPHHSHCSPCVPGHEAIPTALSPSSAAAAAAARILTFRLHAVVGVALVLGLEVKVLMRGAEEHLTS
jgi:hypothetical protein